MATVTQHLLHASVTLSHDASFGICETCFAYIIVSACPKVRFALKPTPYNWTNISHYVNK